MANMLEALEDGAGAGEAGLFKYPHLQLRNVSFSVQRGRREERVLDMINIEARGGELLAILATSSECLNYIYPDICYQENLTEFSLLRVGKREDTDTGGVYFYGNRPQLFVGIGFQFWFPDQVRIVVTEY